MIILADFSILPSRLLLLYSYNEFIFAMSGGDMTHYLITGEGGSADFQDLANAPAIIHQKAFSEASFVASLKKKLSVRAHCIYL